MSKRLGIPLVAANDIHFLERSHHEAHDVTICIGTAAMVHDERRLHSSSAAVGHLALEWPVLRTFPSKGAAIFPFWLSVSFACSAVSVMGTKRYCFICQVAALSAASLAIEDILRDHCGHRASLLLDEGRGGQHKVAACTGSIVVVQDADLE